MPKYSSIDHYIAAQPEDCCRALKELKRCILSAVPDAVGIFNYGIPAFTLVEGGKRDQQIMIAGFKKHVGFYPHPSTIEHFSADLKDYKQGKGSVQFPLDKPVPAELIIEMVKYRKSLIDRELK